MDTRKFHIGSEEYQFNKQALKSLIEAKVKNEGTTCYQGTVPFKSHYAWAFGGATAIFMQSLIIF